MTVAIQNQVNNNYIYPLLINGERYFLNKDPFIYAEEGVAKYWPQKVEELSYSLAWSEYVSGKLTPTPREQLDFQAARMLAADFLADADFFKYFKQDGGDMIKETKPLYLFPETLFQETKEEAYEEREIS